MDTSYLIHIYTVLRAGRSGDRTPVGARFSAPVQTGPGAYRASCTMDTGSFPGVKRPGRGADHPPPSKRRVHERAGLYLYPPSGPQWPVIGRTLHYLVSCFFYMFRRISHHHQGESRFFLLKTHYFYKAVVYGTLVAS